MKFDWPTTLETVSAALLVGVITVLYRFVTYPGEIQVEAEYSWVNSFIELYPEDAALYGLSYGERKKLIMAPNEILQFYALAHPIRLHVDIAECEYNIVDRILWRKSRIRAINYDGATDRKVRSSWVYKGCTDKNESRYGPHWVKCCFAEP